MGEEFGLGEELAEYITKEEAETVDSIYLRAKKRKEDAEAEEMKKKCPCGFVKNTCDSNPIRIMEQVKQMLGQMCKLCRTYNCCTELENEELPDFLNPDIEEPL